MSSVKKLMLCAMFTIAGLQGAAEEEQVGSIYVENNSGIDLKFIPFRDEQLVLRHALLSVTRPKMILRVYKPTKSYRFDMPLYNINDPVDDDLSYELTEDDFKKLQNYQNLRLVIEREGKKLVLKKNFFNNEEEQTKASVPGNIKPKEIEAVDLRTELKKAHDDNALLRTENKQLQDALTQCRAELARCKQTLSEYEPGAK